MNWPSISIIIPVYNGGWHLEKLLTSIREQDYPQDRLEILVVDDDSEDNTVELAKAGGGRVLRNGSRHIERGKAIGLANASHEYVLFLDADNYLTRKDWMRQAIEPLPKDATLVGSQSIRFHLDPQDPAANRYCSLFGINDPMAYYLNRRDRLTAAEDAWKLMGRVEDCGEYYIGTFALPDVPTLGSQGFLTRKSLLQKVDHDPYLFHMEANLALIKQGYNRYVLLKSAVGHDHVQSASGFVKKCRRNIELFYKYRDIRTYRWELAPFKLMAVTFMMVTGLVPFWDACRGFVKKPDWAWFLHPWFCLAIPAVYATVTVKWRIRDLAKGGRP